VRGGAVIVPGGLVRKLEGEAAQSLGDPDVRERQEIERLAMRAVEEAEVRLGRVPRDVSNERGIGYDIESKDLETGSLYFIEVKGKWEGKDDVTLTKNEIFCSRNEPEKFRLAVVVVGEGGAQPPRYLKGYAFGEPDFAETTRTFSLRKLLEHTGEPT
jgi:hypothetical protein